MSPLVAVLIVAIVIIIGYIAVVQKRGGDESPGSSPGSPTGPAAPRPKAPPVPDFTPSSVLPEAPAAAPTERPDSTAMIVTARDQVWGFYGAMNTAIGQLSQVDASALALYRSAMDTFPASTRPAESPAYAQLAAALTEANSAAAQFAGLAAAPDCVPGPGSRCGFVTELLNSKDPARLRDLMADWPLLLGHAQDVLAAGKTVAAQAAALSAWITGTRSGGFGGGMLLTQLNSFVQARDALDGYRQSVDQTVALASAFVPTANAAVLLLKQNLHA